MSFDVGGFFLYYVILGVGSSCNCQAQSLFHYECDPPKFVSKRFNSPHALQGCVGHIIMKGYTMADQTSNEISHVQSVNKGRELQRSKIKTNLSVETQATLQKNTEELGVDVVKKQISIFFKTPFDQLKKL